MTTRGQTATGVSATGSGPIVLTWTTNPAAGSKVTVLIVHGSSNIVTSVIDNGTTPTTFTRDFLFNGGGGDLLCYRADNITLPAAGSYHVTVVLSASTTYNATGRSYTGVVTGAPSSSNDNTGTGTAVTTGNVTPPASGSLVIGGFATDSGANPETITLNTAAGAQAIYTNTNGTLTTGAFADNIPGNTTAQGLAWTLGDSPDWGAYVLVYAPASGTAHTAAAALTVTPARSAARTRGQAAAAALTVTPARSAARTRGQPATAALTVTPARSASAARGGAARTATAALTVTPARSAAGSAAGNAHTATAALTVTPARSASAARGGAARTATAALTVTPACSAVPRTGHTRSAALTVTPARSAVPSASGPGHGAAAALTPDSDSPFRWKVWL